MAASDFVPRAHSGYLFAGGPEERAAHLDHWRASSQAVLVEIETQAAASFRVNVGGAAQRDVFLRSRRGLSELMASLPDELYLDITGLAHHTWAPLLRAAIDCRKRLWGVYVEPGDYTRNSTPTEGTIYDLSERILGIAPLPGFATLQGVDERSFAFVPLLGFEGTRLIHVGEHVQAPMESTVPIVGVPGFRAEYPFVSLKGNRKPLVEGRFWTNTLYATANCPFDTFFVLRSVLDGTDWEYLRIAPIGTKPHGLGAVLFALSAEDRVELIYDHPIRKPGRTTGSARLCLYDVSTFVESDDFHWAAALNP